MISINIFLTILVVVKGQPQAIYDIYMMDLKSGGGRGGSVSFKMVLLIKFQYCLVSTQMNYQ